MKEGRAISADGHDLVAERTLDAAVGDVFDAYTDAEAGRTVFAGAPDWVVEVTCDLRVGGVWRITSSPPGGAAYREANRFTVVDRPRRLAFRSALTMPDGSSLERDVEVTFARDDGDRTRMTIVQRGFPSAEVRDAFAAGFPGLFDRLAQVARGWPGHAGRRAGT
jgi:uncharacterized protein YndB with AHSA1/START domain